MGFMWSVCAVLQCTTVKTVHVSCCACAPPPVCICRFYTPELEKRVKDAYRMDYSMMEIIGVMKRNASGHLVMSETPTTGKAWRGHSHTEFL